MARNLKFYFFVLIFIISACSGSKDISISQFSSLLGDWKTTEGLVTYESWFKRNDTLIQGLGYKLIGKDTIIIETLIIKELNDNIVYQALVLNQNQGRSIYFILRSDNPDSLVFENPKHDYPNRITYIRKQEDQMEIKITGFIPQRIDTIRMQRIQ